MSRPRMLVGLALAAGAALIAWRLLAGAEALDSAAQPDERAPMDRREAQSSAVEAAATLRSETAQVSSPETAAPRSTDAPPALWRLAVIDESGRAVRGANVLALEADGAFWEVATDEQGLLRAPPADGEAQVFVAAVGRPLEHFRVPRSPSEHSVSLSRASAPLVGIVTVNGVAPVAPLTIVFEPRHAPFADLELPEELRRKLFVAARLITHTEAAGRFTVDGAPLDWSGNALAPRGHVVRRRTPGESAQRRIAVEGPSSALLLEFERLPHLVGRAVDAAGGAAPAGTDVRAAIHSAGGSSIAHTLTTLDADGSFEIALREARLEKAELTIECDSGQLSREIAGADLHLNARGDLDAGTLVLSPRAALRVRVLDADGLALPKARARIAGESTWSDSDQNGEAVVKTAASGDATLSVIALGHLAERRPVQLPTDAVVEVRMRRANRLELELVDSAGAPLRHVVVRMASTGEPLFSSSNSWYPDGETHELALGEFGGGGQEVRGAPRGWFDVQPSREGRIAIEGLSPRAAVKLSVLDQLGQSLLERDLAALGETERRVERLRVDVRLVELSGRVSDASGEPIGGARVQVANPAPEGDPLSTRSDPSGRYAFLGLSGARVSLEVDAEGFVARRQLELELRPPSCRFDIVLERR